MSVGVLYLWGYWSTFNVNILEYLSLVDVIRLTAYPIASAFAFMAIGAVFGEIFFGPGALLPGGGRNTKTVKFLRKIAPLLIILYVSVTVIFVLFDIPNKWLVLPVLLAPPLALFAKRRDFLVGIIPYDSLRTIVIYLLAVLPTFAYGQGRLRAADIVDGRKFDYVLSTIDEVSIAADASPVQKVRYLGHAGDFLFYLNPVTTVLVITKFQEDKSLLLKHFDVALEKPTKCGK